uniref:DED domain-containing protein n=1 Tax=Amphimedon queenslandica TaxID=400682 RepID=A0A1X7TJD1_AMPQE
MKKDHGEVDLCFTECLASWLRKADGVEDPTIDTLIAALRGIGENADVADGINGERQSVRNFQQRIDQVPTLRDIVNELHGKYVSLVLAVKKSLKSNCINIEDAKFLIKEYLKRKASVAPKLMSCVNILKKVNDFESFFDFLSDFDFIGYLNYKLLKKLIIEFAKNDDEINQLLLEYEKEYAKQVKLILNKKCLFLNRGQRLHQLGRKLKVPGRDLIKSIESHTKPEEVIGLLEAGADPNATEYPTGGSPALIRAIEKDNTDIVKLLLEKELILLLLRLLAVYSTEKNNIEIVDLLLKKGADPNATKYSGGPTALITAIEKNNIEIVELLLKKGADPNATKHSGGPSALIMAFEKNYIRIFKVLLKEGADPNVITKYSGGPTALIIAIKKNNFEIVEVLLEKGADPNIGSDAKLLFAGTNIHAWQLLSFYSLGYTLIHWEKSSRQSYWLLQWLKKSS